VSANWRGRRGRLNRDCGHHAVSGPVFLN